MPAVPIIAAVAIDTAAVDVATAALTTIAGATFAATVGGGIIAGAVGGAAGGALEAGIFGGDPGMGALSGAISQGAGGGVGTQLAGVSPIEKAVLKGATSFGTGTAAGLLSGQKFGQALKGGAVSGISSGIASGIGSELGLNQASGSPQNNTQVLPNPSDINSGMSTSDFFSNFANQPGSPTAPLDTSPIPPLDLSRLQLPSGLNPASIDLNISSQSGLNKFLGDKAQSALSYGIKSGISDLFGSNVPSSGQPASGQPSVQQGSPNPTPSPNLVSQGPSPSVDALAQALRTVGDLGYSPGGPVFGSQSNAPQRKVWNKASLRVTDENQ